MRFRFVVIRLGRTDVVSRKYVGDYRLENVTDRRGKLRTVPVYRGPLFRFISEEAVLKKAKKRCLLLTFLITAALLATMILHADILSRVYVVMPLVLSFLPTALLWAGIYSLFRSVDPVPRDKSDRIHNRFAGWSVVLIALTAFSLIGQIAAYFGGAGAGNIPITVCTAAVIVCACLIFREKQALMMEEIPADG